MKSALREPLNHPGSVPKKTLLREVGKPKRTVSRAATKPVVVSRAQWGAKAPLSKQAMPASSQKGFAGHYSASDLEFRTSHSECAGVVRTIQKYHMSKGYQDIAYNFLYCNHGYIFVGRSWGIRSAAQGTNDGNAYWHAFCYLGGPKSAYTPAAESACRYLYSRMKAQYPKAVAGKPHSAFKATACPGSKIRAWINEGKYKAAAVLKYFIRSLDNAESASTTDKAAALRRLTKILDGPRAGASIQRKMV